MDQNNVKDAAPIHDYLLQKIKIIFLLPRSKNPITDRLIAGNTVCWIFTIHPERSRRAHDSPLPTHDSRLTTHHSPLTTHEPSSLVLHSPTHYSLLTIALSPLTIPHPSIISHASSIVTRISYTVPYLWPQLNRFKHT